MLEKILPDDLWKIIEPLIPPETPRPKGGRPRHHNRQILAGILYIHRYGIPWRDLPLSLGLGSGRTCQRRFQEWQQRGFWSYLWQTILNQLQQHHALDWNRGIIDSTSFPAPRGGEATGPNPTDRGKKGSKFHMVTDAQGIPLALTLTGANVHDSKQFQPALQTIPNVKNGKRGRPRRRPLKLHADKGYDYPRCRAYLRSKGIKPRIARRGIESSERLGRHRWKVERTLGWLMAFRKLAVRRERNAEIFLALGQLGCALIAWRHLQRVQPQAV